VFDGKIKLIHGTNTEQAASVKDYIGIESDLMTARAIKCD
jgi:hypothetical protein